MINKKGDAMKETAIAKQGREEKSNSIRCGRKVHTLHSAVVLASLRSTTLLRGKEITSWENAH